MKLFTKEQVESLLEIIDYQTGVFISTQMGESVLSTQDKYILNKYGFDQKSIKKIPPYFQSFVWGRLSSWLDENQANKMVYDDFLDYMHSNSFIPLSRREQDMYDIAVNRSYSHIKNLGNTRKVKLSSLIDEEDIRREMSGAINNRESLNSIVSNWGHQTGNWNRDYGRIAETEMNSIFQLGRALAIERSKGLDTLVWKKTYKLACRHCIRLHLTNGIGSKPIVLPLRDVIANGENIGRKVADWKFTISSEHPFCRCMLSFVPEGYEWDQEKQDFVPSNNWKRKIERKSKVKINWGDKIMEV
jgi:hypothetical protein